MVRTYFIRNIVASAKKKTEAIGTIERVAEALGINIAIPAVNAPTDRQAQGLKWEAQIINHANQVTATINVYRGMQPDLDLPHLDISDRP